MWSGVPYILYDIRLTLHELCVVTFHQKLKFLLKSYYKKASKVLGESTDDRQ